MSKQKNNLNEEGLGLNQISQIETLSEIILDGYKYKYKDKLKNDFSYRCIFRSTCKLTIMILFNEYTYIKNINNNPKIKYKVTSSQKEHTCKLKKQKEIETNKILNSNQEKELAKTLILNNIDQT